MIPSRTILLLVAASLLALACGEGDSTSPTSLPRQATQTGAPWASGMDATRDRSARRSPSPALCEAQAPILASGTFGSQGGTLRVGQSFLVIPGGALTARVIITATTAGDNSSTINFQPEGLRFRKPAILVISSVGCSIPRGAAPSVVYLGAAGDVLETIPADYDRHRRRIAAAIQHFSGYAIAF